MSSNQIIKGLQYTDRDLIEAIVNNYFIVDYGYISKVNADGTVNVTHAKKPVMQDGTELPATETKNLEVLTLSLAGFAVKVDYAQGDQVLLLGLKDFIKEAGAVTQPETPAVFIHYTRATMKALPLCTFKDDAKIIVEAASGTLKVAGDKLELNGNNKQFVTWAELNQALQQLWTSIQTHTHTVSTTGSAAAQSGTAAPSIELSTVTLDISKAKTTTVVTGG